MGILLVPKPVPQSSAAPHAIGWKAGQQVSIPTPNPAWPGYGAAMDRFSNWRGVVSPLGGTAEHPWSQAPKFGEDALRPEFRRGR
jgi:hypothetical protein